MNDPEQRFMASVNRLPNGCWEWTGARYLNGYGQFQFGKLKGAHRFSYFWFVGPIPRGYEICHTCDNPSCVNPEHLFLGTPKENTQDAVTKGRIAHGTRHGRVKLTPEQVEELRNLRRTEGIPYKPLGQRFGVSAQEAWNIVNGRKWKSVPPQEEPARSVLAS